MNDFDSANSQLSVRLVQAIREYFDSASGIFGKIGIFFERRSRRCSNVRFFKNMIQLFRQIRQTSDWQAAIFVLVIVGVTGWIGLIPFSRSIQTASLKRFHLATEDFSSWAIQQPIPAMYNFENRYWANREPLDSMRLSFGIEAVRSSGIETNYLNHFPARAFTFAESRAACLHQRKYRWLYLHSRYRDNELWTVMEAIPDESGGGFTLMRRGLPDEY